MKKRLVLCAAALSMPLLSAPTADAACRNYQHRAKVESTIFGTDLAYLYIRKRACYNGNRVTRVSRRLEVEPRFTDSNVNIEWVELASRPKHRYVRWRGRRRGAHYSKAVGTFKATAGPVSGNLTVEVAMTVYGDGTVKKRRKNANGPFR